MASYYIPSVDKRLTDRSTIILLIFPPNILKRNINTYNKHEHY